MKHPPLTQVADRALSPLIGKSLVMYARKPVSAGLSAARPALSQVAARA